jgi:osmotically-inducible protein OsmY
MTFRLLGALVLATIAAAVSLSGCVPLVAGAAVAGTALVATDRRSVGAQADDEAIEIKLASTRDSRWGDKVHINVTSYDGIVLLCGEAPDAEVKSAMAELARTTDRVKKVYDEVEVKPSTSMSDRTNDTYVTSKVKSRFLEQSQFSPTHVKVVTERSVVYLMGLVRKDEGDSAARIASTTSGVTRVVKLFEYI